jgi:hypothetical protein
MHSDFSESERNSLRFLAQSERSPSGVLGIRVESERSPRNPLGLRSDSTQTPLGLLGFLAVRAESEQSPSGFLAVRAESERNRWGSVKFCQNSPVPTAASETRISKGITLIVRSVLVVMERRKNASLLRHLVAQGLDFLFHTKIRLITTSSFLQCRQCEPRLPERRPTISKSSKPLRMIPISLTS